MNYEPACDPQELIQRLIQAQNQLQTYNANELARFRSQYGASHEQVEALVQQGFLRLEQALAGAIHMLIDEISRPGEAAQSAQEQMARRNAEQLAEVLQRVQTLTLEVSDFRHTIIPMLPMQYGSAGPYRILPGQGLSDPAIPQEVEDELKHRNGLPLDW